MSGMLPVIALTTLSTYSHYRKVVGSGSYHGTNDKGFI
jgi:hypothetical protein